MIFTISQGGNVEDHAQTHAKDAWYAKNFKAALATTSRETVIEIAEVADISCPSAYGAAYKTSWLCLRLALNRRVVSTVTAADIKNCNALALLQHLPRTEPNSSMYCLHFLSTT